MNNNAFSRLIAHTARRGNGFAFIEADYQPQALPVRLADQTRVIKPADFIRRPWVQNQVAWQASRIDPSVQIGVPVFVRRRR